LNQDDKTIIIDSNNMQWEEQKSAKTGLSSYKKIFHIDPKTGMRIHLHRYPAGFMTPWHKHNCSHGMYVLEGTLYTDKGCLGPGGFVWFPEGVLAEHGATEEGDVTVLFITDKTFDIQFV